MSARRWIALTLMMMVFACPMVRALDDDYFLPWGIPFGCDVDTFLLHANNTFGQEFMQITESYWRSPKEPGITMFDNNIEVWADFSSDDGLLREVDVNFEEIDKPTQEALAQGITLLTSAIAGYNEAYGHFTGASIYINRLEEGYSDQSTRDYNFPMVDGGVDYKLISTIALENTNMLIGVHWKNVMLLFETTAHRYGRRKVTMSIQFKDEYSKLIGIQSDKKDYVPGT